MVLSIKILVFCWDIINVVWFRLDLSLGVGIFFEEIVIW